MLGVVVLAAAACQPAPPQNQPPTTAPPTSTPPGQIPAGLPSHFGVGLSADPGDVAPSGWVASSGVPFDYAYQYLAGGVNNGQGWQTWNTNAQFPLWYANDAHARSAIPVFPYYNLLQSSGPCSSCAE